MKNSISILGLMFLAVFLCTGTSFAGTFTYDDNEKYWPGYNNGVLNEDGITLEDDNTDSIGNNPDILNMTVTTNASNILQTVVITFEDGAGRTEFDSLFINSDGYDYEWDYYILDGDGHENWGQNLPDPGAYTVADGYADSIVTIETGRQGHINGIQDTTYIDPNTELETPFLKDMELPYTVSYNATSLTLTYTLGDLGIDLGDEWRIGYSSYCANDVISGSPVPEPATLILLGSGLLGFAGLRRKQRKQQ